jgi:hypothetical protein
VGRAWELLELIGWGLPQGAGLGVGAWELGELMGRAPRTPRDGLPPIPKPSPPVAHRRGFMNAFKPRSPPTGGGAR